MGLVQEIQNPYRQQEEYYKSLQPPGVPTSCFSGDLMHYLFAENFVLGKKVLDAGCGLEYPSE